MIKGKDISFDFDGCLNDYFDGKPNPSKFEIRKTLVSLSKNNNIHIITRRYGREIPTEREWIIVHDLANELNVPLENVHFTNREMKVAKIRQNNIYLHFDDDQYELSILRRVCKVVNVESPKWKGEIPND